MSTFASRQATASRPAGPAGFYAAVSLFLGLLVGVLAPVAILLWLDARDARNDARHAVANQSAAAATSVDVHAHATAAGLES